MSSPEPVDARWSTARWATLVGIVFAVLVSIVYLATGETNLEQNENLNPVSLLQTSGDDLLEQMALGNPAWLALPNLQGNSVAWLTNTGLPPHKFYGWTPTEQWLEYNATTAGLALAEYLRTNRIAPRAVFDKPLPDLVKVYPPALRLRARTTLERTGALAGRPLAEPIAFSSWPHSDVLPSTVVQVDVSASGLVLNARLLRRCGLVQADTHALDRARLMRFKSLSNAPPNDPLSLEGLATGNLIFNWHTLPGSVTNTLQRPLPARTVLPR
jgi:hypothetical protein